MQSENVSQMYEETISDLTDKITIVLKDGRIKLLPELSIEDLGGIYEKWEYGGVLDPIGSLVSWLLDQLDKLLQPVKEKISNLWTYYISPALGNIGSAISTLRSIASDIQSKASDIWYRLSGIGSNIQSIFNQLMSIGSNLSSLLSNSSNILNAVNNLYNWLKDLPSRVWELLTKLNSFLAQFGGFTNFVQGGLGTLQSLLGGVKPIIDNMYTGLQKLYGILNDFGKALEGIRSYILQEFSKMFEGIKQQLQPINAIFSDPSNLFKPILGLFEAFRTQLQNLYIELPKIPEKIGEVFDNLKEFLNVRLPDGKSKSITEVVLDLTLGKIEITLPDGRKKTLAEILMDLINVLDRQAVAFMGFTNPLSSIDAWLNDQFNNIGKWIWEGIDKVYSGAGKIIKGFIEWASKSAEDIYTSIENLNKWFKELTQTKPIGENLYEEWAKSWIGTAITSVFNWENFSKFITWIWEQIVSAINWMITGLMTAVGTVMNAIRPAVDTILKMFTEPILKKDWNLPVNQIPATSKLYSILIPEQQNIYQKWYNDCANTFKAIWDVQVSLLLNTPIRDFIISIMALNVIANATGLLDKIEVALTPVFAKVGAKLDLKSLKGKLKDWGREGLKEWAKTMIFTFSFWVFEPVKYIMNPLFRGWLPIEVPTLHEIIEISRRYLPDNEYTCGQISPSKVGSVYKDIEMYLYDTIAKRGYPLWFDSIIAKGYGGYNTIIRDRFNTPRVIPSALLFSLPAPSDCVRMMLRDMIQSLDDFGKIMLMHGFHPDVSALYFMLHFRYPSTERLFEFACRVASGIVWVDENEPALSKYFEYLANEKSNFTKWGLGFEPATPKKLADIIESKYPLTDLSKVEQIARQRVSEAFAPLGVYFKWHDLFPMAWIKGQTSDQMIAMELSADIPMRIDARWMYKWGVISDREVVRIVMARGMHPKWVEKIAIAEMMNAMAEERTIVRTGIMNSFKEGFFKEDRLMYQLSNLTTITLLDREVPVKFLEGEVKLMALRAKYDRALDILLNAQKSMFMAYAENMVDYSDVKNVLRNLTSIVANQLKIPLMFDDEYYDTYRQGLDVRKVYETVSRIRRWLRYAILEVMSRVKSGYLSDNEIKSALEMLRHHARLTDEDVAYFYDLAKLMRSQFDRQVVIQAILKKLSKGEISKDTAMELMIKAGLEESVAESLIELHAKTYSLSIAQYISYANYLDIPTDYLEKKLDILGVPPDEKKLILAVFEIKPIASERDALVKRYLDEFENGYIDENTVRDNLKRLGVLPKAIDLLIEMKKVEKSMNAKKILVDAVLNKLKRGVIRLEDAINELKKYIVDESLIYALIEKYVRTYTFSPDKMISIAEYVPVDLNWIIEKAKLYGYPEEEVKLIPAYAVAREISEEMKRLANELGQAFAEGLMTEEEYAKALDELATLGGQAKTKFGVDWIVLSPEERYTLVQIYKVRAIRKLYSKST
ncbi:MAG: hypothetical protein QXK24_02260 [Ignisphaera sp.]